MSKYRTPYIKSHCIELFFRYGEKAIHAMTDGNRFPDALNELERNRKIQKEVAERARPGVFDNIVIAPAYATAFEERLRQTQQENLGIGVHLEMFFSMAELGFYSFDCVETDENGRGRYELVARPGRHGMNVDVELPEFDGIEPIMEGDELVGLWM